jgi:hypothetical protein
MLSYPWGTERVDGEPWSLFVERCAEDSLKAIERWPGRDDLPTNRRGRTLYNLTWASEAEYPRS